MKVEESKEPEPVTIAEKRALIAAKIQELNLDSNYSSDGSHGELSEENIVEGH